MSKKNEKRKNPVKLKKDGRYFNTITKRYVSEAVAKRLNSFYLKHPEATLAEAHGRITFATPEKPYYEMTAAQRKIVVRQEQAITTTARSGKKITILPLYQGREYVKIIDKKVAYRLRRQGIEFDIGPYHIRLYRQSKLERGYVYHLINGKITDKSGKLIILTKENYKNFYSDFLKNIWLGLGRTAGLKRVVRDIIQRHPLGPDTRISVTLVHELWDKNIQKKKDPGTNLNILTRAPIDWLRSRREEKEMQANFNNGYKRLLGDYEEARVHGIGIRIMHEVGTSWPTARSISEARRGIQTPVWVKKQKTKKDFVEEKKNRQQTIGYDFNVSNQDVF